MTGGTEDLDDVDDEGDNSGNKVLYETACELIKPMSLVKGTLQLTKRGMLFLEERATSQENVRRYKDRYWDASLIRELHMRRYLLRPRAMEFFFTDQTNCFIHFPSLKAKMSVHHAIVSSMRPPNLAYSEYHSPAEILRRSGLTEQWVQRRISNFDYIMQLNTLAGRSYNDLRQYPVFPWVVADYTSAALDLASPATFRDLSKPMGAQSAARAAVVAERYAETRLMYLEGGTPPSHYGTHYSNPDVVFYYMIRMEPFTSYFLRLQKFDWADRMFGDVGATYRNILSGSDVKELIPEFYYLPDFLVNSNRFNLGTMQSGKLLDDVELPPWAHGSAEEFVRLNRAALESDYVSAHLHEWIDLIFGCKQRGDAAERALNVFSYVSYEGAVDLDRIEDELQRASFEDQILNFGQTPTQLLRKPHPARRAPNPLLAPLCRCDAAQLRAWLVSSGMGSTSGTSGAALAAAAGSGSASSGPGSGAVPLLALACPDRLCVGSAAAAARVVTVDMRRAVAVYRISPRSTSSFTLSDADTSSSGINGSGTNGSVNSSGISGGNSMAPFGLEPDTSVAATVALARAATGVGFARDVVPAPSLQAMSVDGRLLVSCGYWDNTFKVLAVDSGRLLQSVCQHRGTVTCAALGRDGRTLVTGARDTTLMVWVLAGDRGGGAGAPVLVPPRLTLFGHDDEVSAVAVNCELDVVVSGARDGAVLLHTLRTGTFVWSASPVAGGRVSAIHISPTNGLVVVYSQAKFALALLNINGRLLVRTTLHDRLSDMLISRDGEYLVTAGSNSVVFRTLHKFAFSFTFCYHCSHHHHHHHLLIVLHCC